MNRFSRTCAVLLAAEDTGNKTCKPQDISTSSHSHYHFPTSHIVTVSSLARTIVSEFLQKARMRASGVMVSDLQNPARVWPVCHAVLCCAAALVSAGSQPLASDTAGSTGRSGRDNATFVSSLNCQEVSPKDTRRYSKENLSSSLFCKLSPRKPTGSRE